MKLKKLIKDIEGIEVRGSKEIEITGVSANSRSVSPGNLFVARKSEHIAEAVNSGASAILTDLYDPSFKDIAQIICKDIKKVEPLIAAAFHDYPSEKLAMVGVTGTSGKTSVSYYVKHLLEKLKGPAGLIGTVEYQVGNTKYPATHTTPDVTRVHKLLREMVDAKLTSAVMEVSSHALDQERVKGVHFDTAVFTNLSSEHLDYHKDIDEYASAKEKLFHMLELSKKEKTAIVNADDPWSHAMLHRYKGPLLTYGIKNHADVRAVAITQSEDKIHFIAVYRGINCKATLPKGCRFSIYNFLAAIAVGLSKGFSLKECVAALETPPIVPGRLESVENRLGISVLVDYSHKPGALETVLQSLLEIKKRRIIVLFGCGGDRDPYKRPMMASIAEKYADKVIVTSDNPRTEDPLAIIDAITKGFQKNTYIVEPDRKKAIELALEEAEKDDIVLIAGKGHENTQIFANQSVPFDDRLIAKEFLNRKSYELR